MPGMSFCKKRYWSGMSRRADKRPPSTEMSVLSGSCWLRGRVLNIAAGPNKITLHCCHPSINRPRSERRDHRAVFCGPRSVIQTAGHDALGTRSSNIGPSAPLIPITQIRDHECRLCLVVRTGRGVLWAHVQDWYDIFVGGSSAFVEWSVERHDLQRRQNLFK